MSETWTFDADPETDVSLTVQGDCAGKPIIVQTKGGYLLASSEHPGFMSIEDKVKLDAIDDARNIKIIKNFGDILEPDEEGAVEMTVPFLAYYGPEE